MTLSSPLRFGPLGPNTAHLCIDMQNMFAEDTPWHTPWMTRVLPRVAEIAERHAAQTIFTRLSRRGIPTNCRAAGGAITGIGQS